MFVSSKEELNCERRFDKNHTIYEAHRKSHQRLIVTVILLIVTFILGTICLTVVGYLQYSGYKLVSANRTESLNASFNASSLNASLNDAFNDPVCDFLFYDKNFETVSTSFAAILLIIYIFLYKRRSFLVQRCKFHHIGLPMIVSCWNKTDRFYTCIMFGRISYEIFGIILARRGGTFFGLTFEKDPSGILKLLVQIFFVFVVGIRYYPVLVAFRVKETTLYILSTIYMWFDLFQTVYQLGICESLTVYERESEEPRAAVLATILSYISINSIPTIFLSSYIIANLTYRSFRNSINAIKTRLNARNLDYHRNNCSLCTINDDHEVIYCQADLEYTFDLLNKNYDLNKESREKLESFHDKLKFQDAATIMHNDVGVKKMQNNNEISVKTKSTIRDAFSNHIYQWQSNFRFSSRFVNMQVVAFIVLYHSFIIILYGMVRASIAIHSFIPDTINWEYLPINFGDLVCVAIDDICDDKLKNMLNLKFELPSIVQKFGPKLRGSLITMLITCSCVAFVICMIQFFLGLKDTKTHLIELYKGICTYVPPRKQLSNPSIASSSFHYGGYLVGYLVWGYFIVFLFLLMISSIIIFIRFFIGDDLFLRLCLKCIPIIVAFVLKTSINSIVSRFVFLHRNTKILAVNNFRAFNIFLYFSFFFDCFIGFISAFIRIVKTVIAGVFMMPRISYAFMGRKLETFDDGFNTYVGFLYMEAAHTNPILLSFCCLLYYEGLSDHIKDIRMNKIMAKNTKLISLMDKKMDSNHKPTKKTTKIYKKHIINKWHVMMTLMNNPVLIYERKNNMYRKIETNPFETIRI